MTRFSPKHMVMFGVVLLLIGAILPLLMVVQIITSNLFLNFLSYAASISGLVIGTIGAMMLSVARRKRE